MAKVIFVRAYLSPEEQMGPLARLRYVEIPTGLCSLAAVTRQHGHETQIVDGAALQAGNDELADSISRDRPDLVGISAYTPDIYEAADLVSKLKKTIPGLTVIVGGPHISATPAETMKRFPAIDIGVLGEGEATIVELLDALQTRDAATLSNVAGIIFRRDGGLVTTLGRQLIANLDDLPLPAWNLLPRLDEHYCAPAWTTWNAKSAILITSRGCPNQCIFCDRSVFGNRYRYHSAEYVLRMIATLRERYGITCFRILDDNFVLNKKRVLRICDGILAGDLHIRWSCVARADCIDRDILQAMKAAGCTAMSFGIESGSQEILDFEKKNISLDTIAEAVRITKAAGIRTMGYNIIGHPHETVDTLRQTIAFNKKIGIDDCQFGFLVPYPGTELHGIAHLYGSFEDDWRKMSHFRGPTFIPHGFTRQELVKWGKKAYLQFYLRPRTILSYLGRVRSPAQLKVMALGALTMFGWLLGLFKRNRRTKPQ